VPTSVPNREGSSGGKRDLGLLGLVYRLSTRAARVVALPLLQLLAKHSSNAALVLSRTGSFKQLPPLEIGTRFWLQAVSVGEVELARRFAAALLDRFEDSSVILTASTPAGQRALADSFPDEPRIEIGPFPFDDTRSVVGALDAYQPSVLILLETELWPTLIRETDARGIPIAVLNGRLSARSERYYRCFESVMVPTLAGITLFGVQAEDTAMRLARLGVAAERIVVTGNMKYDNITGSISETQRVALLDALGLSDGRVPLMVAGSTRPGEEDALLTAFCQLRADFPELKLVLAPRHLRRLADVEKVVRDHDLQSRRRSGKGGGGPAAPVILLDTMGELRSVYSLADVTFVGGGLFPGTGGHNPLEPAALGKPVLFGPYMDNCREIADSLVETGGAVTVTGAPDIVVAVRKLLTDEQYRNETGARARNAVYAGRGVTDRNLDLLAGLLGLTRRAD